MNNRYLERLFEKFKEELLANDIKTVEDFTNYIKGCVKNNLLYDFNMYANMDQLFGKGYIESNKSSEEIAERLYELAKDMDYMDYEDTKEKDIAELEEAIYTLKLYARSNKSFELLFDTLDRL